MTSVLKKPTACSSVAREGWFRAEEVAYRVSCGNGLGRCKTSDLKLNLETALLDHFGERSQVLIFLSTILE